MCVKEYFTVVTEIAGSSSLARRSSLARPSLLLAAALSLSAALSRAGGLDTASGLPPTPASLRRTRRTSRIAAGALAIDSGPVSPRIPSHRPSGGATAWTFWPLWCFYSSPTAPSTLHRAPSTTTAVDSLRCTPREACVHFSRCSDRSAPRVGERYSPSCGLLFACVVYKSFCVFEKCRGWKGGGR